MAELIPDRFEYRAGVTYVGSTVEDLLEAGAGVCQDFAHLALVLLRRHGHRGALRVGLPVRAARRRRRRPTPPRSTRTRGSRRCCPHPTAASRSGSAADPTNRKLAGERHVKIGHGRHYSDVPPVKGVFRGGAAAELDASVRMTRTDAAPRGAPAAG